VQTDPSIGINGRDSPDCSTPYLARPHQNRFSELSCASDSADASLNTAVATTAGSSPENVDLVP
jgi:hypothetical protein